MGLLVDGEWHDVWYDTESTNGKFVRGESAFRNWVTADGSPGPTGKGGFEAAENRYHLYVSHACPWAHRTLVFRMLKNLEDFIPITVVDHYMAEEGWTMTGVDGSDKDELNGATRLYEIYQKADPQYSGRVTVPVLWDKQENTIASNESADIIRMFNSAFNHLTGNEIDYYPEELRGEIDAVNADVYDNINNGVYKCGFATTQEAYEEAFEALFDSLQRMEERLEDNRYLVGDNLTEADWRLFTTLVRFDPVYVGHFKCNQRRISEYPNLINYLRELYQIDGIAETVNLDHIKKHYYGSHKTINPTGIVPKGPKFDLMRPHDRERFWR